MQLVTVVSGKADLSTADGRMVARIQAAVDAAEAERTGERVARAKLDRIDKGLPIRGRYRHFGYTADYSTTVPEEAAAIREAVRLILTKKMNPHRVAKHWAKKGLATVTGKKSWLPKDAKRVMTPPQ